MRTITFNVNQQRIKNTNSIAHIYQGTNNYLKFEFNFSEEWDGCAKAISFSANGKEVALVLKNNSCSVPEEAFDKDKLTFYLVGMKKDGYRVQTQKFIIRLGG